MIIQAELRRKQSEYEGEACAVDKFKVIILVLCVDCLTKEKPILDNRYAPMSLTASATIPLK